MIPIYLSKNRFCLKLVGPHLRPTLFFFLKMTMMMMAFVLSSMNETGRTAWEGKGRAVLGIGGFLKVGNV